MHILLIFTLVVLALVVSRVIYSGLSMIFRFYIKDWYATLKHKRIDYKLRNMVENHVKRIARVNKDYNHDIEGIQSGVRTEADLKAYKIKMLRNKIKKENGLRIRKEGGSTVETLPKNKLKRIIKFTRC